MSGWTFAPEQIDEAHAYFEENGFVGFRDLLPAGLLQRLRAGVEQAVAEGRLTVGEAEMANNNDCVFAHPAIDEAVRHPLIVQAAERLIGQPIELQHSKFNAKPVNDLGGGEVRWHQDYPFYPHSNFDLISCGIHLDDEDEDAGPLRMINGSHNWGPQSHVREDGSFAYECTGRDDLDRCPSTLLMAPAGTLSFHHALTMHTSAPKRRPGHRRVVIFQYRAMDAVQLAGAVWRCHGMQVADREPGPRYARFTDGRRVELRGMGGRLLDLTGQFAPDAPRP